MSCDVDKATEGLENELWHRWSDGKVGEWDCSLQRKGWRMSSDVGEATEGLENELWRRWRDGNVGDWACSLQRNGWRMSYDVGKATEVLENELWRRWSDWSLENELAHSPNFRHFTYVTVHSQSLPSLYLRHSSFSNPSVASPTPQIILQPFFRFSYVISSSLNSPGEPPILRNCRWLYCHCQSNIAIALL